MEDEKDYKVTHSFYIAGVQFHEMKMVINDLTESDHLSLVPEPDNKYDPNAVRIELVSDGPGTMLGFVPKKFSLKQVPRNGGTVHFDEGHIPSAG